MYSVYGKRPSVKGEKGFPFTQTDQEYHTLQEVLDRLVRENGRIPPPIQDPGPEDSLDDIDPTKQRGFDIADAAMIMSELNAQVKSTQDRLRPKQAVATDANKAQSEKAELAEAGGNADGNGPRP